MGVPRPRAFRIDSDSDWKELSGAWLAVAYSLFVFQLFCFVLTFSLAVYVH